MHCKLLRNRLVPHHLCSVDVAGVPPPCGVSAETAFRKETAKAQNFLDVPAMRSEFQIVTQSNKVPRISISNDTNARCPTRLRVRGSGKRRYRLFTLHFPWYCNDFQFFFSPSSYRPNKISSSILSPSAAMYPSLLALYASFFAQTLVIRYILFWHIRGMLLASRMYAP